MAGKRCLMISGRYDLSFLPEFSQQAFSSLDEWRVPYEKLLLPCGHYTLASFPFNWWAALRFVPFLRRVLA